MSKEQQVIEECAEALRACRPYVSDGRGDRADVERIIVQIDEALKQASDYAARD